MLTRVTLVATKCPLMGDYGYVLVGQTFDTNSDVAKTLIRRGLASEYVEPAPPAALAAMLAEVKRKMSGPQENKMLPVTENKADPPAVRVETPVVAPAAPPVRPALYIPPAPRRGFRRGNR